MAFIDIWIFSSDEKEKQIFRSLKAVGVVGQMKHLIPEL
jgi:hypothetical protein